MIRYYQLGTFLFALTTIMWFSFNKQTEAKLERVTNEKLQSDSLLMIVSEDVIRLRKHVRINFILDSISNQNTHTKRIKQNHRELLNLTMD